MRLSIIICNTIICAPVDKFDGFITPYSSLRSNPVHPPGHFCALTSGNEGLDAAVYMLHYAFMMISPRDGRILCLVGRFGQVTSGQIRVLEFSDKARSRSAEVLSRMVASGMLATVEQRLVGGWTGGSGQNVYRLTPKGWRYLRTDKMYRALRTIDRHRLAIVDAYVKTVECERAGTIRINEVVEEPECYQIIAGVKLTPDLYLNADLLAAQTRRRIWVEVDMGTERRKQITEKLARYRQAYRAWGDERPGQPFPKIVFMAIDEERERELQTIINEMSEQGRKLFAVCRGDTFPQVWG